MILQHCGPLHGFQLNRKLWPEFGQKAVTMLNMGIALDPQHLSAISILGPFQVILGKLLNVDLGIGCIRVRYLHQSGVLASKLGVSPLHPFSTRCKLVYCAGR